jgi:hypothetical protein
MSNKQMAARVKGLCGKAPDAVRMIQEDPEGNKEAIEAIEREYDRAYIELDRQLVAAVKSGKEVEDPAETRRAVMRFFENSAYDRPVMGKTVDQWVREDPSIIHEAKRRGSHPALWQNNYTIENRGYGDIARGVPGAVRKPPRTTSSGTSPGKFLLILIATFIGLCMVFGTP